MGHHFVIKNKMSLLPWGLFGHVKTHTARAMKIGLLYWLILARVSLVSRVMYVICVLSKNTFNRNEWPLRGANGNNWPGRLLGAFVAQSTLSWNDLPDIFLVSSSPVYSSVHTIWLLPQPLHENFFCKGRYHLIATIQWSLFSFHSTVFHANFVAVDHFSHIFPFCFQGLNFSYLSY